MSIEAITGRKILVTGVTGWVAGPLAESLASAGNTVYGAARFNDPAQRQPWHDKGVQTVSIDLENGRLDEVPADLDLVLHFAVAKSNNFAEAFAANAHGSADLMETAAQRSDNLTFFHCSSTAVYEPKHGVPRKETDLLGDSHRPMPGMPTYSISKIAGEVLVQHTAKRLGVPGLPDGVIPAFISIAPRSIPPWPCRRLPSGCYARQKARHRSDPMPGSGRRTPAGND